MLRRLLYALGAAGLVSLSITATAQTVTIDAAKRQQTIDGFGTCLSGTEGQQDWWKTLYFDDLEASMLRFDLVAHFKAPYSDRTYNSPWYHNDPALPGPDGNNVRTYTSATDYTRTWAGHAAQIAVMGPNIDQNVAYFDFDDDVPKTAGLLAQLGNQKKTMLGDFKLFAALWSPAPWLKLSSGNKIGGQSGNLPVNGTAWPFIWGGNFSGGVLDTSGTARAEFDDSSVGGSGPTSALTQFARGLAAYLRGFQQKFGVKLYSISIQNELNFETFYNSCSYPLSSAYIAALKAARAELDKYSDLKSIRIMGPEDLLGGDGYGMWQYGAGSSVTHKNLQYLDNIAQDAAAASAVDFFCIHGYAQDGVNASGSTPVQWQWWAAGWQASPGAGLPSTVKGFTAYNKKSWMTETSGEAPAWLSPSSGFPSDGAFSIAMKIHQALTAGRQSAWVYWQLTDGSATAAQTLTDATLKDQSPKYVAAKHFFRYVRPGAMRVDAKVAGGSSLLASAYVHDAAGTLTVVLVNTAASDVSASVSVPSAPAGIASFEAHTSKNGSLWKASTLAIASGSAAVTVPGYGVVTLYGSGTPSPSAGGTGGASGSGGVAATGGSSASAGTGAAAASGSGGGDAGASRLPGASGASGAGDAAAARDGSVAGTGGKRSSGCGCRIAQQTRPHHGASLALGLLTICVARRRRARRATKRPPLRLRFDD